MKGCNDHGCLVEKPVGMGTNGRCRCPEWKLRAVIKRIRAENERLKTEIDLDRSLARHILNLPTTELDGEALELAHKALNAETEKGDG